VCIYIYIYLFIYLSESRFFENGETDVVAKVRSFPSFTFHDTIEVDDKCATESALAIIQPTACPQQ
jgi:hypothetical protein